jgi:hypothetical protein
MRLGFFFVDKRFEISNQSLIKDIMNIIEIIQGFSVESNNIVIIKNKNSQTRVGN